MTKAIDNRYYDRKDRLTVDELNFFEKELDKKMIKIQKSLEAISKELKSVGSLEPRDEGDHAMLAIDSATNNRIFTEQQKSLILIKRSLNKIKFGTYGICVDCEEAINIERLKVKNFTECCIDCQEERERGFMI